MVKKKEYEGGSSLIVRSQKIARKLTSGMESGAPDAHNVGEKKIGASVLDALVRADNVREEYWKRKREKGQRSGTKITKDVETERGPSDVDLLSSQKQRLKYRSETNIDLDKRAKEIGTK